jgi:hypothetical protein
MKDRKNKLFAVAALLVGAVIGVVLGFLYEPPFDRGSKPT